MIHDIIPKIDIKSIIKDFNKEQLQNLISIAQGVLASLFSFDEIKENIKESRFLILVKYVLM
ncbi:hypothetical protein [Paraclostridium sordellii]|uniref:hypothetical protein n=1 Tax=Paraclostridium sordellii TaxID=1505 RepID=UPI00189A6702|nr:hypothetical protein [Paeniclostridium sordellii]MCR1848862.1 hypothetical protein [Paeniclostridium sordellii]